jgi:VIT1/CCC1 family predicted Fe2+/Mn2+ transporter
LVLQIPNIVWMAMSAPLLPWAISLVVEDEAIRFAGSVSNGFRRTLTIVAVLLGGMVPLFALHFALGYGAIGRRAAGVWIFVALDSVVVCLLATMIASAYYSAYRLGNPPSDGVGGIIRWPDN